MNFHTISVTELQDFESSCRNCGLNPKDFQLKEDNVVQTPAENGLFHLNADLTISRNGKSKTYRSGHNTCWPADFDNDLKKGFFNSPSK